MRVLHAICNLASGGTERRLTYLARGQAARGYDVHVAIGDGGPNLARLLAPAAYHDVGVGPHFSQGQSDSVRVHTLPKLRNHDPRLFFALVHVIREVRPDLVHTWLTQMDVVGGLATHVTRVPHVLSEASCGRGYARTWKNRLRERIGSRANAIVANSPGGGAYWQSVAPETPRWTVGNGLPLADIDAAMPASEPDRDRAPLILAAGRFDPMKNFAQLTRAVADVRRSIPGVVAIMCGEGPASAEVARLAAALGITGRVTLPGFIEDVWPLMKRASVFVSISEFEGCPNSVLEAMACGCPVVLSDIPAHRAIADDSCALFVRPSDVPGIAAAIRLVLCDPAAARERADVACTRTRSRTVERMVLEHEDVYSAVLTPQTMRAEGT